MRPTLLERFKLGVDSFSENKKRSPPVKLLSLILLGREQIPSWYVCLFSVSLNSVQSKVKKQILKLILMLQYKSSLVILCFWYNFSLFIRVQPSFSGFSFLFSPSRSTMTAEGVFLLVLIVMVLPCSSLEGKCHETQLVTSDLKRGLLLLRGEVPVCIDRQILVNFSCLASLAVAKDYSRSYTITRGSWAQTLVVKMCNGCLCSPSHCDSC